ncbi:MAG: sugar phosphate isomerase/epimerase [Clostridia bacterium]|nr:sugar phosphate isomerase/epimerase [Clostridia bacterium]
MKKFPLALQLYSVRDFAARDFEGTLRAVKEMGYDGVEFAGLYGKDPAAVKALLCELGLVPVSAHVPFAEMKADPKGVFALYRELGCEYVAVPYLASEDRPGCGDFENTVKTVKELALAAKQEGLTLLYHNHDFEFVKLGDGRYGLDTLYEEIPADLLQTELDTCWVNVAGEDPAHYVRKYTNRAPVVHLKDFVMPGKKPAKMYALIGIDDGEEGQQQDAFSFRPVGYGAQNVEEIVKAAEDAGSVWLVVEQDAPSMGKNSMECAKMSIEYLKELTK